MATNFTVHSCGGSRGFDRVPFLASAWAEEPRKRKATHGLRMGQCFGFFLDWGHIRCCGNGLLWFRPYGGHFFQTPGLRFGVWGHIRSFGCCLWRFRSYSESPFPNAEKVTQKALPPAYGTSLRLSVPSLRCPSGGIASGLLRCTSSRCMRLRRMALRAYPPDGHLRSACRRGKRSKAKARSKTRSRAPHPSPLPEGEGTDRGAWESYADVKHPVELRF